MKNVGWKLVAIVSGLVASQVAKQVTKGGWKAVTGKPMPQGSKDPQTGVAEALVFAAVSGSIMAATRMYVDRKAAGFYEKSTGHPAPEVAKLREATEES